MAGESAFQVEGVVTAALPNRTYRVKLSNGHELRAYVAGKANACAASFAPGQTVKLQMAPYDLSEGRIIVETKKV
jgi:translation initiation factor IF-1